MIFLTISVAGLQFTWGVEQSYVNIFLISLGMSKSMLSVVWAAGPVSGLLMQPIVGAMSDNSTSRYGRRRPFMIIGTAFVTLGLCLMAWSQDVVGIFGGGDRAARILATFAIFITDFAINSVQACCRAIIVDTLPPSKQEYGNGWAGRMIAGGHLVGYFLGTLDLVSIFGGLFGNTQLKSICVASSLALIITVAITSLTVTERVQLTNANSSSPEGASLSTQIYRAVFGVMFSLRSAIQNLPRRIALIFTIQLCAWYGWFSFLFYSATWVSEIYESTSPESPPPGSDPEGGDKVGDVARVGAMSLVVFSTVSLVCSLILPMIMKKPNSTIKRQSSRAPSPGIQTVSGNFWLSFYFVVRRSSIIWNAISTPCAAVIAKMQKWVAGHGYRLEDLWFVSHLVYAFATFMTGFVSSVGQATALVGLCGFCWALVTWAPFSLLAEEIHALAHVAPQKAADEESTVRPGTFGSTLGSPEELSDDGIEESMNVSMSVESVDTFGSRRSSISEAEFDIPEAAASTGEQSGVYLGIHNVAITIPQLFSTLISAVVFSLAVPKDQEEGKDGGRAVALTLQIGAFTALAAAYFTRQLRKTPRTY